jgi:chemotaxis protein MotB
MSKGDGMKFILGLFILLLLQGCVSSSKYEKLEGEMKAVQGKNKELQESNRSQGLIVEQLKSKLGDASADVEEMRTALKEAAIRKVNTENRIAEYSKLLKKFKKLIDSGRLQVKIVRGRMVVQLDSDILFKSGSAKLSEKGMASIKEVSQVLASIEGKEFQIEGHTDNVPIKTPRFPSNWELASARAMTVLKTLLDSGMSPEQVSIASFGKYKPTASNDSQEGKAANRRIEIVVVPDLSQLPGFDELNKLGGEKL